MRTIVKLARPFVALASTLDWLALLLARLGVGWIFTPGGWEKLHGIRGLGDWFGTLGIPLPYVNAAFVSVLEFVGGLCLIVGFGTRLFSLLLIGVMAVALITVGPQSNPPPDSLSDWLFKSESILIFIFLLFIVYGPGKLSIDQVIADKQKGEKEGG